VITALFSPATLAPRGQPTVTEKVMSDIRALLIKGTLAPGSRIDQIDLARRFKVSIVPIREALARLASVGLVEIVSHRGVFVAQVSADELIDLYTVREILEEQAAKIAVDRLTDADVDALDKIADAMARAARKKDLDQYLMLNRELHFTLYRATKRRYMMQVIEQMWDLSARYAHLQLHAVPDRASKAMTEIRAIVAACRRRDREEVGLMVRYKVHQTSVGLLERMPLPAHQGETTAKKRAKGDPDTSPASRKERSRMDRRRFLEDIAASLGRAPLAVPPARSQQGPPEDYMRRPLGAALSDRTERFALELELVGGKVAIASALDEVHALLFAELELWRARRIVSWAEGEFRGWALERFFVESRCTSFRPSEDASESDRFRQACLAADVGITGVDYAIANTGTLAIAANVGRPRSVSLLPTVHIALVRETQLVDRLGLAFAGYRESGALAASNIHFITGPSRTSDIENDLSIGVHGPAAVSVIVWRDSKDASSPAS
jgi:L-lactate dehydrogenase complex protein LldG